MANDVLKTPEKKTKIIIIGTGFSGIAAAIRLKQEKEQDFIILERKGDVGGVWRDNQYPGCTCDIESNLYSFSFAPNPKWSKKFARQPEIHNYIKDCANKFQVTEHIYFNHNVIRMDWDNNLAEWVVKTNNGTFRSRIVIGAFGVLSDPAIPDINGLATFKGETFHSADWPKKFDPVGKRVAVIGTGASAIQFIPLIQPDVAALHVFQRTAPWILPRLDDEINPKTQNRYKKFPISQKVDRSKLYIKRELRVAGLRNPKKLEKIEKKALKYMHTIIKDPVLRKKLTPNYKIGCKRILISNTYYSAFTKPNVDLNTAGITEVTEDTIIDLQGNKTKVDTIIFGTGFKISNLPFAQKIYGKSGHSLAKEWQDSPNAYLGETVAGFPNLFILQGPNTGLGHSSVILMIEAQVEHMIKVLKYMNRHHFDVIEVNPDAQQRFVNDVDKLMADTVWTAGGCSSWYLDKTGRNFTLWPTYTHTFTKKTLKFDLYDYTGRSF